MADGNLTIALAYTIFIMEIMKYHKRVNITNCDLRHAV